MSIEFTAHILKLPYVQQIRHWAGPSPWRFEGVNVRLTPKPARLTSRDVAVSSGGALTRIKHMVERPCFGSPTAFLTHSGDRMGRGRNGQPFEMRCHRNRCPAAEACAYVAKRRLRATDPISTAHDDFEEAGGMHALNRERKEGRGGRAMNAWARLVQALADHGPFPCKNAEQLRVRIDARLAEARRAAAESKAAARLAQRTAAVLAGTMDEPFLQELRLETSVRALVFDHARSLPKQPLWIANCGPDAHTFTAEVWRAKMLILARGERPTPGKVARQLVNDGLIDADRENAQRNSRIDTALARVHRLETIDWTGQGTTWERTSVEAILAASAALEPPASEEPKTDDEGAAHPLQITAQTFGRLEFSSLS